MKIVHMLAALALPVAAADSPSARLIGDIEGVYKHRYTSRITIPGKPDEKYDVEDVVEVVHHDDAHIYVRAALTFDNGHRCGFHGIAGYENGVFVYHDPNPDLSDTQACMVTIAAKGETLTLTDRATPKGPSTCKSLCGARGSLGDYTIAASHKAKISHLPHLKASKEYRQAVKAYEEAKR
jgi:hypothetical protein